MKTDPYVAAELKAAKSKFKTGDRVRHRATGHEGRVDYVSQTGGVVVEWDEQPGEFYSQWHGAITKIG